MSGKDKSPFAPVSIAEWTRDVCFWPLADAPAELPLPFSRVKQQRL
jgi:hypothetical protein